MNNQLVKRVAHCMCMGVNDDIISEIILSEGLSKKDAINTYVAAGLLFEELISQEIEEIFDDNTPTVRMRRTYDLPTLPEIELR